VRPSDVATRILASCDRNIQSIAAPIRAPLPAPNPAPLEAAAEPPPDGGIPCHSTQARSPRCGGDVRTRADPSVRAAPLSQHAARHSSHPARPAVRITAPDTTCLSRAFVLSPPAQTMPSDRHRIDEAQCAWLRTKPRVRVYAHIPLLAYAPEASTSGAVCGWASPKPVKTTEKASTDGVGYWVACVQG
jgi:hypothetical protein